MNAVLAALAAILLSAIIPLRSETFANGVEGSINGVAKPGLVWSPKYIVIFHDAPEPKFDILRGDGASCASLAIKLSILIHRIGSDYSPVGNGFGHAFYICGAPAENNALAERDRFGLKFPVQFIRKRCWIFWRSSADFATNFYGIYDCGGSSVIDNPIVPEKLLVIHSAFVGIVSNGFHKYIGALKGRECISAFFSGLSRRLRGFGAFRGNGRCPARDHVGSKGGAMLFVAHHEQTCGEDGQNDRKQRDRIGDDLASNHLGQANRTLVCFLLAFPGAIAAGGGYGLLTVDIGNSWRRRFGVVLGGLGKGAM
jgi:hypothetical protein